jgi:hypothetical protein
MTVPERVAEFLRNRAPVPFCDDCIKDQRDWQIEYRADRRLQRSAQWRQDSSAEWIEAAYAVKPNE